MQKPKLIESPDLAPLKQICQDYLDFVDSEEYHEDSDYRHYIYETAMQCLFGENVFDYINKRQP